MASHISIKFLVVGDENVGKTTIVNYFTLVPIKATSTIGIDFQTRIVALSAENIKEDQCNSQQGNKNKSNDGDSGNGNGSETETMLLSTMKVGNGAVVRPNDYDYVKCCFWDTSGSSNYQCLAQTYYTGIAAVIVVFDLSNQLSYNHVNSYIARVIQKNTCNHSHPILVLGNKLDERSIRFTKKQVFEALCFDFPHEKITYEEVSCIDKPTASICSGCADSSDIHVALNSFIQSLYDSVIKPHYYNPLAITEIGCRGITGTSRFFQKKKDDVKNRDRGWNWKGNYTDYIRSNKDKDYCSKDYIQMVNLKSPRDCCSDQGLERVSSCASGCSIM